jgi:hypothetical protein
MNLTVEKILQSYPKNALEPLDHMKPHIRISPFSAKTWADLLKIDTEPLTHIGSSPAHWLDQAIDIKFFNAGRSALLACLKHLNLIENDEVFIVTTTQGPYISGCVTKTIERVCKWSRTFGRSTKLIMVIHEFGFAFDKELLEPFKNKSIPILEDCAYGYGSRQLDADIGTFGDFALYSLPKYFPIPFGGLLASKEKLNESVLLLSATEDEKNIMLKTINKAHPFINEWNNHRRNNWNYFKDKLGNNKFEVYLDLHSDTVPGVYITKVNSAFVGEAVKKQLNDAGVESTQYYNQGGFFFPTHQHLTTYEKEYILHHFLKPNKDK